MITTYILIVLFGFIWFGSTWEVAKEIKNPKASTRYVACMLMGMVMSAAGFWIHLHMLTG
ncbi:MAG TPA: hypothetical protein O0X23_02245 [Methanocorpusculum sp.]|nr:hypothetical protein [Methanocorpusculum sp.]